MNDACNHSSLAFATVTPLVGVDAIGFELDINGQRMRHVASLQDQVVRDQLVAAGWTPPDASLADVPGIPWPRASAFKPAAHQSGVDWHGLALELTAEAQRAPSKTMVRAMEAAANGLRQMGQYGALPLDPVLLEAEAALEVAVARVASAHPGATRTSEHLGLAAVRDALAGAVPAHRRVQTRETRANRVYVAGPMTGLPEFNFPAFNAAAAMLRSQAFHVENPAEHGIVDGAEWADYLHYDLGRLATCDEIYLLPGWSKSRGAALEALCAHTLGMTITYGFGAERVELVDALQVIQSLVVWPLGLASRIEAALKRIEDGSCYRRIPADPTDPDLVLAEVLALIQGRMVPFWLAPKSTTPTGDTAQADRGSAVEYVGWDMARGPEGCSLNLTPAARDVLLERIRQVGKEGYNPEHDDEHVNDEIAAMAALFIMPPAARDWDTTSTGYGVDLGTAMLPHGWAAPRFGDRRRQLVKGAAMALAEIERLDRAKVAG